MLASYHSLTNRRCWIQQNSSALQSPQLQAPRAAFLLFFSSFFTDSQLFIRALESIHLTLFQPLIASLSVAPLTTTLPCKGLSVAIDCKQMYDA